MNILMNHLLFVCASQDLKKPSLGGKAEKLWKLLLILVQK